ncbi:MAG: RND transporter [Sutterellaceae bacterium]|nr:RND transporter [Sutterellaceae bacterium]
MEAEAKAKAKAAAQSEMADGEIRKINKNTGKITVKHGEIKSVEMPPMTMVFGVADKAMLEGLKEGDKVKFNVKQEGSNYTVTEIKKAQ